LPREEGKKALKGNRSFQENNLREKRILSTDNSDEVVLPISDLYSPYGLRPLIADLLYETCRFRQQTALLDPGLKDFRDDGRNVIPAIFKLESSPFHMTPHVSYSINLAASAGKRPC